MQIEFGISLLKVKGFDQNKLPIMMWTRDLPCAPRVGEDVEHRLTVGGITLVGRVTEVVWVDDDKWDVSVFADATSGRNEYDDITLEDVCRAIGVPELAN